MRMGEWGIPCTWQKVVQYLSPEISKMDRGTTTKAEGRRQLGLFGVLPT
jgi:hypothetical protein